MSTKFEHNPKKRLKQLVDRPWMKQEAYKILNKMVTELSLYMNPIELDKCMDFLWTCEQGEFDTNLSVGDCETQLKLILGSERYEMIRYAWCENNQKLLTMYGTLKYKSKMTGELYDGLDDDDDPKDYEKIYV